MAVDKQVPAKPEDEQVLLLSTFPYLHVVLQADEHSWREGPGGKMVKVEGCSAKVVEFCNHKALVSKDDFAIARGKPWYGTFGDFVAAKELRDELKGKNKETARLFIRRMNEKGKLARGHREVAYEDVIEELAQLK